MNILALIWAVVLVFLVLLRRALKRAAVQIKAAPPLNAPGQSTGSEPGSSSP